MIPSGGDTPGEQEPHEGGEEAEKGKSCGSLPTTSLAWPEVLVMLMPGGRDANLSAIVTATTQSALSPPQLLIISAP